MSDHDIRQYEARGNGALDTAAIQAAIDAAVGGRVVIPPGVWRTGMLRLRSGVHLHLSDGATLLGSADVADYPAEFPHDRVQSRRPFSRRLLLVDDCQDVVISGPGTIDGNHGRLAGIPEGESRPLGLQAISARNLIVRDLHLRNSGSWMQQYLACTGVRLERLRVHNHGNPTNDGLDLDGCSQVTVSACEIDSHDDALVFKSTGPAACRDITVRDCLLRSNCNGIKFGTESVGGFQNITVEDCRVGRSSQPAPLPDHPQGRPPITAVAIECTDGGTASGLRIRDITADEGVFCPLFICLGNRHHTGIPGKVVTAGTLDDIHVARLQATGGPYPIIIAGYPGHPVRNVTLEEIEFQQLGGLRADQILKQVPEVSDQYPEITMFTRGTNRHLPAWGLWARHVEGLTLRNCRLVCRLPDARPEVVRP
jgi:polygalacturonase